MIINSNRNEMESLKTFINNHMHLLQCPALHPDYVIADAKRDAALAPIFFYYEDNRGAYYYPCHKRLIKGTSYYEIISPYGCGGSAGGPVTCNSDPQFLHDVFNSFSSWCKKNEIIHESTKFHPLLDNWQIYHGKLSFIQNDVYVDLTTKDLFNAYRGNIRTSIKKAKKNNVIIKKANFDEFLQAFPSLYKAVMTKHQAEQFFNFNNEYFAALCQLEIAHNLVAVHENEIIAGAIFLLQDKIFEYHLSAASAVGKQLCATSLLLHEAFDFAKMNGATLAYLGGGTFPKPDDPLEYFKMGFSGLYAPHRKGFFIHEPNIYKELMLPI